MQIAYSHLAELLPVKLVDEIELISNPPTRNYAGSYVAMMEDLRSLVNQMLHDDEDVMNQYDSIAQWEIAMQEIIDRKPSPHIETIDVHYNPVDFVEYLKGELKEEPTFYKEKRRIAIFWDERTQSAKAAEITPEIELLLSEL